MGLVSLGLLAYLGRERPNRTTSRVAAAPSSVKHQITSSNAPDANDANAADVVQVPGMDPADAAPPVGVQDSVPALVEEIRASGFRSDSWTRSVEASVDAWGLSDAGIAEITPAECYLTGCIWNGRFGSRAEFVEAMELARSFEPIPGFKGTVLLNHGIDYAGVRVTWIALPPERSLAR